MDNRKDRRVTDIALIELSAKIENLTVMVEQLNHAFPEGAEKHREAHEAWQKAKEEEAAFWKELKLEVAKKGAIGLVMLLIGVFLVGVSVKLRAFVGG